MQTQLLSSHCKAFLGALPDDAKPLFMQLQKYLGRDDWKLAAPRNIVKIYALVPKITRKLASDKSLEQSFITILEASNGKPVIRRGAPTITLDFTPLIERIKESKIDEPMNLEVSYVNRNDLKTIKKAAEAIDRLSEENLGHSFGRIVYEKMIQSDAGLCLVAEDPAGNVIGCLFGALTMVDTSRVFHFWTCVRKANCPEIRLVEQFAKFEQAIADAFDAEFLTLSVDVGNESAARLYEEKGYLEVEQERRERLNEPTRFMVKKLTLESKQPPGKETTVAAITEQVKKTVGLAGTVNMMIFLAKQKIRPVMYS